ncbi:uncharacterized protein EV154DRAFT_501203 [Mucor mucedo]|uniref:uncharacterized protein n=1 Tax=Mucor mucedo TaxID=29922 RepID=UPI00222092F9|nr:uncharacterized protein EV154DRAFT_501203 [Mucor mucedo]KAI7893687.1 hypothetical protein EV154DRAFT_501203 [Mucor mucedo]
MARVLFLVHLTQMTAQAFLCAYISLHVRFYIDLHFVCIYYYSLSPQKNNKLRRQKNASYCIFFLHATKEKK